MKVVEKRGKRRKSETKRNKVKNQREKTARKGKKH